MKNKDKLRHFVTIYNNWIADNIDRPVLKALRVRPEELEVIFRELKELMGIISNGESTIDSLDNKQRSYLKSSISYCLYSQREESERRSQLTTDPEIKKVLAQEVEQILEFTETEWFRNAEAFETPILEKFLIPMKESSNNKNSAISANEPIFEFKPNYHGLSLNLKVVWAKMKSIISKR